MFLVSLNTVVRKLTLFDWGKTWGTEMAVGPKPLLANRQGWDPMEDLASSSLTGLLAPAGFLLSWPLLTPWQLACSRWITWSSRMHSERERAQDESHISVHNLIVEVTSTHLQNGLKLTFFPLSQWLGFLGHRVWGRDTSPSRLWSTFEMSRGIHLLHLSAWAPKPAVARGIWALGPTPRTRAFGRNDKAQFW